MYIRMIVAYYCQRRPGAVGRPTLSPSSNGTVNLWNHPAKRKYKIEWAAHIGPSVVVSPIQYTAAKCGNRAKWKKYEKEAYIQYRMRERWVYILAVRRISVVAAGFNPSGWHITRCVAYYTNTISTWDEKRQYKKKMSRKDKQYTEATHPNGRELHHNRDTMSAQDHTWSRQIQQECIILLHT